MRWKGEPVPVRGQSRIRHVWLLFPRCINDEWRWLERAGIEQVYDWVGPYPGWEDCAWADGDAAQSIEREDRER